MPNVEFFLFTLTNPQDRILTLTLSLPTSQWIKHSETRDVVQLTSTQIHCDKMWIKMTKEWTPTAWSGLPWSIGTLKSAWSSSKAVIWGRRKEDVLSDLMGGEMRQQRTILRGKVGHYHQRAAEDSFTKLDRMWSYPSFWTNSRANECGVCMHLKRHSYSQAS